ncbi:MAG: choice-of-anchor D domain-containing protein [Bacteroidales bacterium]|nr:choice-of-anchor D domain-containing protein [Bacteroidales bacterium]MCF8403947.1 choice-of-anchor D domain-containing protein [Bacteroidales bacterium]
MVRNFKILITGLILSLLIFPNLSAQKSTKDWTIVATYDIPGKASGLAWDGTYIYFGIYGSNGDQVHKFDPATGNNSLLFTNPSLGDSYGMTFDGTHLWTTDHVTSSSVPATAIQLDLSGNIVSQFDLPDHYMSGIAYDNGDFWVATYYPDPGTIYKVDASGNALTQFTSPNQQPWDLCLEGTDLWVADYNANNLYKIDQSGSLLETHACENIKPAGIVYDGQYLWYVDGELSSNSTLYKVDLGGSGTPQIEIPVTNFNYGNVALGDSLVWECSISNTGTADLEVTNLVIPNAVPIFVYMAFPQTIAPGNSIAVPFIFKPTETGTLNATVTVQSTDPVNPDVDLILEGEAVFNGPHIVVPVQSHNYGTVRLNATTRWMLEVSNDGNATLEVSNISFDSDRFYLDESVSFPINISILQSEFFGIWFNPDEATSFSATATITHDDGTQNDIPVSLTGSSIEEEYPIGELFWSYTINTSWDNSVKAIAPISDVNNDGIGDVIVCSEDDFVRCFNGNSSGSADILWEVEGGSVYAQNDLVTIEDINNDGVEDVITGMAWGVRAIIAFSGKTGEQLWIYDTHIYGDGGWVYQVDAKNDYNSDGINDVLAATGNDGSNTGPKRVFCLDGITGSLIWDTYTDGPNFSVISVEDFTGDNLPDAIGGASNNGETEGKVYGINGTNGNIMWTFTTSGTSVWALEQLDDVTGDGVKDIVAGDFGGNYYFINPVTGGSFENGSAGNTLLLRFERLEDINNDNMADVAIGYSGTNAIAIDGNNGGNAWLTPLADKCWNIDKIEDISGDGINDLVAGTLFSSNYCYFLNGVNGEVLFSVNYSEAVDAIGAIPDINGDGSWEMVAGGRNGKLQCFSGGLNSLTLMADFMADTTYGIVPFDVQFTDLSLGNVSSWEWDFENDGVIDSYDQDPLFTFETTGVFTVKLIVYTESISDTAIKYNYIMADTATAINLNQTKNNILAYPNPFSEETIISVTGIDYKGQYLYIYNSNNQLICTLIPETMSKGNWVFKWNGNNNANYKMPPGIYFGNISTNGRTYIIKIILE